MIERILPENAIAVEAWGDDRAGAPLFAEEELALGRAVEKRRREFVTARACAREALARLGMAPVAIPAGDRGEPCWPAGIVGSITHCEGYRACAAAHERELLSVGIDAEPNAPLPAGLLGDIARPEELPWLGELGRQLPAVHWERLLFSAKEAVYKAWFPLARRWLGFEDAVLRLDPDAGTFSARLLVAGPIVNGAPLRVLQGRWIACDGILATAVAVSAP